MNVENFLVNSLTPSYFFFIRRLIGKIHLAVVLLGKLLSDGVVY